MFKSKIHRATVTQADLHYVGSVTVDEDLLDAADLLPGEQPGLHGRDLLQLLLGRDALAAVVGVRALADDHHLVALEGGSGRIVASLGPLHGGIDHPPVRRAAGRVRLRALWQVAWIGVLPARQEVLARYALFKSQCEVG